MSPEKTELHGLRIDRGNRPVQRQPKWRGAIALLSAALIAGGFWWWSRPQAVLVQTAVAREEAGEGRDTKTLLNASGYVTARRAATVSSKVTGKVVEVSVEEGMKVELGQILARLDAANVEAALRLAEAQLQAARSSLEETRPNLAFAQQELKRFGQLAATRVVSDSDLRRSEMESRALEARLARQTSEIAIREREVEQCKQQLDDTVIRAPFTGIVTSKNAQPGEMISPMSSGGFTRTGICTIVDMSSLEIEVDVNESYINRIQPKQAVEATLDAYADWRIPAKVIAIIPTADRQKATVKVRVGFDQLDERILPEMGVKVAFQSDRTSKVTPGKMIFIPRAALRQEENRDLVWVVRDGRVERRAVTVRDTQGNDSRIAAGLAGGEKVVVNPPATLAEGTRISEKSP
ncbi:MAG TPA: efflux RND transporter periplasmic adaptor subunit [Chthoniobacteraceae bacterium]|jgi:RND family efflux transporter MFP subunit